jgi:hypothetical protein
MFDQSARKVAMSNQPEESPRDDNLVYKPLEEDFSHFDWSFSEEDEERWADE